MTIGRSPQLYCRCRCSVALYCSPSWCGALSSSVFSFVQKWLLEILFLNVILIFYKSGRGEVSFLTFGRSAQLYRRCHCSVALYCSPSWCGTLCTTVLNFVKKWGLHALLNYFWIKNLVLVFWRYFNFNNLKRVSKLKVTCLVCFVLTLWHTCLEVQIMEK